MEHRDKNPDRFFIPSVEVTQKAYEWLKAESEKNLRSMTKQLICVLEDAADRAARKAAK